jgi:uncharacterized protein with gpF-like domain
MANNLIQIDELNNAIKNALDDYNDSVVTGLKKNTKKAMKDLVDNTKSTAPVGSRSRHSKDNISSKTVSETQYGITKLWYVKGSDYRLSHLLNNGHALRDGGRYPGTNFIGNAVSRILPWYLEKIEEVCRNG